MMGAKGPSRSIALIHERAPSATLIETYRRRTVTIIGASIRNT